MQRRLPHPRNTQASSRHRTSSAAVPLEHNAAPAADSPPQDWSQLGRRVMAEAWRRLTDERATRRSLEATPAAPAPREEEGQ